jgi:hypothetical protein
MGSTNLSRSGDDPTLERREERSVADVDVRKRWRALLEELTGLRSP